jgi:hypothetical protein
MVSLSELSPQIAQTIRRIISEKRTRRSIPIVLGSKSPVIVHPTSKDTENNVPPDNSNNRPDRKVFGKKVAPIEKVVT